MLRVGLGYDSHRFSSDRALVLGGVRITEEGGLTGYSDADPVLHAITDALLGALSAGDIGEMFPETDPRWKDAPSKTFVETAVRLASETGYNIANCDVTVCAERPKLHPHRQRMRENIANLLGVDLNAVSVKAKTNEGMGFIGRGEGIAAVAVVLLTKEENKVPAR